MSGGKAKGDYKELESRIKALNEKFYVDNLGETRRAWSRYRLYHVTCKRYDGRQKLNVLISGGVHGEATLLHGQLRGEITDGVLDDTLDGLGRSVADPDTPELPGARPADGEVVRRDEPLTRPAEGLDAVGLSGVRLAEPDAAARR